MSAITAYQPQDNVRKSNAIIAASYKLTLNEQNVIYAVLKQLKNNETLTDQKIYYVTADDIVTDGGVREGSKFHVLRSVCDSLLHRLITINPSQLNGEPRVRTRWIQSEATYHDGEGRIGIRLTHDIVPYLTQLHREFTRIPLSATLSMSSTYAQRIFEMLMQYRDTGVFKISVADLRQRLCIEDKYKKFKDFRVCVIEKAVQQIHEHGGFTANVQYIKKGRSITDLVFTFPQDTVRKITKAEDQKGQKNFHGLTLEQVREACIKFDRDPDDPAAQQQTANQLKLYREKRNKAR